MTSQDGNTRCFQQTQTSDSRIPLLDAWPAETCCIIRTGRRPIGWPSLRPRGFGRRQLAGRYLAVSTARVSRTTVTLIWPGYTNSPSTFRATSRASCMASASLTLSGYTTTRTSRPA